MQTFKCPKCEKEQPIENQECSQCGVIFNKLLQRSVSIKGDQKENLGAHDLAVSQKNFLPEIGLKRNLEITILNIFAYIYLILGIGAGIGIIVQGNNELSLFFGVSVIVAALITSMLFFVICTLAKKIISIDNTLKYLAGSPGI